MAQAALEAEVDVIGLSSMAGSHVPYCQRLKELLVENGLDDKLWIIGGSIPESDQEALRGVGLDGIFPPDPGWRRLLISSMRDANDSTY